MDHGGQQNTQTELHLQTIRLHLLHGIPVWFFPVRDNAQLSVSTGTCGADRLGAVRIQNDNDGVQPCTRQYNFFLVIVTVLEIPACV